MATSKGQRIAILVIAIVMVVGTFGSFAAMILATQNQSDETERAQTALEEYQTKVGEQTEELSKKYYSSLAKYEDLPAKFDRDSVKKLTTKDLKIGTGKVIDDSTVYAAYYIGWNTDGKVFDRSIEGDSLKAPIDPSMGLIEGWSEGVKGMKLGGIRLLTIPSDLAYGEQGRGEDIPPNTPIKFIVMAIEKPEEIERPAILDNYVGGL